MNQQLDDYISQARAAGMGDEHIRSELLSAGWTKDLVDEALGVSNRPAKTSIVVLPGPISLLKQSWSIFGKRLGLLLGLVCLPWIFMAAVIGVGILLLLVSVVGATIFFLVFGILAVILSLAGAGGLVKISDTEVEMGLKEAFKYGFKIAPAFLLVAVLTTLVTLGGYVLLIIPGIIFSLYFAFSYYVFVHENLNGRQALIRSRELVRGHWWKVFWRFLALGLILLAVNVVESLILGLFAVTLPHVTNVALGFIFEIPSLLIALATVFYPYLIFKNLVAIKGPPQLIEPVSKLNKYIIIGVVGFIIFPVATVVLLSLTSARVQARDVQRYTDARLIESSLVAYHEANHSYPSTLNELVPNYLNTVPVAPTPGQTYEYQPENSRSDYKFCVTYEKTSQKVCGSQNVPIPPAQ